MAEAKYLAFDFGASSGRAILGKLNDKKITLEEMHRFPNFPIEMMGHIYWDFPYLFNELKKGIASTIKKGHRDIQGIGIDTWGVDFGLITKDNQLLGNPFAYRDSRTDGIIERAFELLPQTKFYELTGIQFLQFNSVFQLLCMVEQENSLLKIADKMLFMPDLLNFFLTGEKTIEYSIASTSQMLNARTKTWEPEIFRLLGLPEELVLAIAEPGTIIGKLLPEVARETGSNKIDVIAPASHDTGSAVVAVPAQNGNWAYLSSGTWSLLGIETDNPIINEKSLNFNFTNEGGVNGKIRFLRNTMGLWLLQRCMYQWEVSGEKITYEQLPTLVNSARPFKCIINPDDKSFLNPPDMLSAIVNFCQKTGQSVPENKGEFVRCILESLALKYRYIIDIINLFKEKPVEVLHIVGGGSQNELLNQFTSKATGIPVVAGPSEATALGNVIVQAIAKKQLSSVEEGRSLIANSFDLKHYSPKDRQQWEETYQKVKRLYI